MKHIQHREYLYGGDAKLNVSNIEKWKASIPANRILVDMGLKPITDVCKYVKPSAHTSTMFKYTLHEWEEVLFYMRSHTNKTPMLFKNNDPNKILEHLKTDYLSKTCPYKDQKWWDTMHTRLYFDAEIVLGMRNEV